MKIKYLIVATAVMIFFSAFNKPLMNNHSVELNAVSSSFYQTGRLLNKEGFTGSFYASSDALKKVYYNEPSYNPSYVNETLKSASHATTINEYNASVSKAIGGVKMCCTFWSVVFTIITITECIAYGVFLLLVCRQCYLKYKRRMERCYKYGHSNLQSNIIERKS